MLTIWAASGSIYPLFRSCNGTNWIITNNACHTHPTLLVFPEHLEGKDNSSSGIALCIYHYRRNDIIRIRNIFSRIEDHRQFGLINVTSSCHHSSQVPHILYYN